MRLALQFFSILGVIFGLSTFVVLNLSWWSILFSIFFVVWGIISFFSLSDKKKYKLALKIFSVIGGVIGLILLVLSIWALIITDSLIFKNYLAFSLFVSLLMLPWSVLVFKYLSKR